MGKCLNASECYALIIAQFVKNLRCLRSHSDVYFFLKLYPLQLFQVGEDKEKRTQIHRAIKSIRPALDSRTVEHDGKRCIKVLLAVPQGGLS